MRPPEYYVQDGCWDCKEVFRRWEHDESYTYYCTYGDTEERPLCGSVGMEEFPDNFFASELGEKWEKWAKEREVVAWGKCKNWKSTFSSTDNRNTVQ